MSLKVSVNADKVLLFLWLAENGFPQEEGTDSRTIQIRMFRALTGLSEYETLAAFAELEDIDMVG